MLSPEGLTMAPYKVQVIQDWPEPRKVRDIQSFLGFANFYRRFIYGYSDITVLLMCLTCKGTPWKFLMSVTLLSICSRRLSQPLQSLCTGCPTLPLQSRLTPPTTHSLLSFQLQHQLPAKCTLLHSTRKHFLNPNEITTFMIKSYSRYLKLSKDGDITSKALVPRSMWSPIIGICNIFLRPKSSRVAKHDGPNTFRVSI